MKNSLSPPPLRLALTAAVVTLVVAMLVLEFVFALAWRQPRQVLQEKSGVATRLLNSLQHTIGSYMVQGRYSGAEQNLTQHGTDPDIDVLAVIDDQGLVLFSTRFAQRSRPAEQAIGNFDPVLFARVQHERGMIVQASVSGDQVVGYAPLVMAAPPDQLRPSKVGGLFVQLDMKRAIHNARLDILSPASWWELALAAVLSALIMLALLQRWVSLPLRRLGFVVRRLARGDRGVGSGLRGGSELADLGRGFDHLSHEVEASRHALQSANRDLERQVEQRTAHLEQEIATRREAERALMASEHKLDSVLDTVTDGVALWDREGILRYTNPALRQLCCNDGLDVSKTRFTQFLERLRDSDGKPLPAADPASPERLGYPRNLMVQTRGPGVATRWLLLNVVTVGGEADSDQMHGGFVTSVSDITDLKTHSQMLAKLAHFDTLTGLPNRRLLHDRMHQLLPQHKRHKKIMAICYLDLDGFKAVNDKYDHETGDRLLEEAARRLTDEVRVNDTVARLGGDEFVVLLVDLDARTDSEPVLRRIKESLARPYRIAGLDIRKVSASIGITLYPADDSDTDTLLRHADHAMYAAKRNGKNTFEWFDPAHEHRLAAKNETFKEVDLALRHGEMQLFYQPKIDCRLGRVVGAEALIRWDHPVLGMLEPIQFLPLVEDNELATKVGDFVIAEALRQRRQWYREGFDLSISVNVFVRQLQQPDFVAKLRTELARHPCESSLGLQLEVIEGEALEGVTDIANLVSSCAEIGVGFALDDFGTGSSSLNHLRRIPAGALKIDRSFIHDIMSDSESQSLVRAIIGLGQSFERTIIAEGAEQPEQVAWLLDAGCHLLQGEYFTGPLPPGAFISWVKRFKPDPAWHRAGLLETEERHVKAHRV